MSAEQRAQPMLRVVRGEPTDDEVAALVAVLSARAAGGVATAPSRRTAWNHPARLVHAAVAPGPGGWRSSAHPG